MVKRGPHEAASKHQRRSAAMQHYVGLDLSVKETSVCIIDKAGKVIREVKVATKPVPCCASFRVPFYSPIEVVGHRTCALFFPYVISPVIRLQFLDDPNDVEFQP